MSKEGRGLGGGIEGTAGGERGGGGGEELEMLDGSVEPPLYRI